MLAASSRFGRKSGLPRGEVSYADASGRAQEPFISKKLLMAGKPDYVMKDRNGDLIPVEVKSSNAPRAGRPYESHLMQHAAYFLLLEDVLQRTHPDADAVHAPANATRPPAFSGDQRAALVAFLRAL